MIYSKRDFSTTDKNQNDILSLISSGGSAVFPPSLVESHSGRAFFIGVEMSLPYFREWVDDWRSSPRVRLMSLAQRGLYHEMLCVSWQIGPLPEDLGDLAALIGIAPEAVKEAWCGQLELCWKKTKKGLVNLRLEKERKWAMARTAKARIAATARHRKSKGSAYAQRAHSERTTDAQQTQCHPDPDPDPDPEKNKRKNKREAETSPLVPTGVVFSKTTKKLEMIPTYITWLREQVELQGIELDQRDGPKGIRLADEELQDSVASLEDHLLVNRHKTSAKTLPSLVKNWLCKDLRQKWARLKNRGGSSQKTPLQETIETIQRMNREDLESGKINM